MTRPDDNAPSASRGGASRVRHGTRQVEHPVARYLGIVIAVIVGFTLVYYQTFAGQVQGAINVQDNSGLIDKLPSEEPEEEAPTDGSAGQAVRLLLMGSDVRDGANADIGGSFEGMRNDTTMVMNISADRSRVEVVSIPRDSIVTIPDCRLNDGTVVRGWTGKFNIAFANGGRQGDPSEAAACVQNTVQQMSEVPIDHYVVVDFTGFIDMVDALGGVPMCIPERIESDKADLELDPGAQILDGTTALGFARMRTAEVGDISGSDLQRISRQQELLHQTARTALAKNMLTDIGELTQFIRAGAESLTMDTELGQTDYMLGLAYSLRNIDPANITFTTVPWEYDADYNVEIQPEVEQLWDDLRNDQPLSFIEEGDSSSQWDSGRDVDTSTPQPSATGGSTSPGNGASDDSDDGPPRGSVDDLLAECSV